MNIREKLIELLTHDNCPLLYVLGENMGALADYLLDHGVTVQKWIPVTERLPEDREVVLVFAQYPFDERGTITVAEFEPENKVFWGIVSHWMPLPEPPKGECPMNDPKMIRVEGYRAFRGTMRITPKNPAYPPRDITGDWLYKPDTNCWYGGGASYCAEICEVISYA